MEGFYSIFKTFFPDINTKYLAYENLNTRCANKTTVNTDFLSYSIINLCENEIKNKTKKNKFQLILNPLLSRLDVSLKDKENIINKFCSSQKIYNGFCKLARIFKIKHARVDSIKTDLHMNSLII